MSKKRPILQNNFETESGPPENGAKTGPISPETALENDTRDAAIAAGGTAAVAADFIPPDGPTQPSDGTAVGPSSASPPTAKKKRGPKTPEGKRAVSRNAVKHGIYSPHPVVLEDVESIEAWDEFRAGTIESWAPVGTYQLELVEDIAWGQWRLRRCRYHETFLLNMQVAETEQDLLTEDAWEYTDDEEVPPIEPRRLLANQQLRIIPGDSTVDRVLRYETHVRRALQQTVQELEVRQAHREGKSTPLARVAFSSGPVLRVPGARGTARFTAMKQLNEDLREINSAIGERHTARLKIAEDVRREAREALEPEP